MLGGSVSRDHTRRTVLRGGGLATLGALGVAGAAERASAKTATHGSPGFRVAVVEQVSGTRVKIAGEDAWLPVEGFPDGWRVLEGDKVAVARSLQTNGVSAQPLVHWVSASASPADLVPGTRIGGVGGPEVVQATVLGLGLPGQRNRGLRLRTPLMVAVADRASTNGTDRAIAVREA
jgi:hypothetical protein